MKRLTLCLLPAALALSGCAGTNNPHPALAAAASVADAVGIKPPAPCAQTTGDEKAVKILGSSVDVAAKMSSALAKANVPGFVKGTPSALTIAKGLNDARKGVNAAQSARLACDAKSYTAALNNAEAAFATVKSMIGS